MASSDRGVKGKRVKFNVAQKLEPIGKLEQGVSEACVCGVFGKKQIVSDILRSKANLHHFSFKYTVDSSKCGCVVGS